MSNYRTSAAGRAAAEADTKPVVMLQVKKVVMLERWTLWKRLEKVLVRQLQRTSPPLWLEVE